MLYSLPESLRRYLQPCAIEWNTVKKEKVEKKKERERVDDDDINDKRVERRGDREFYPASLPY